MEDRRSSGGRRGAATGIGGIGVLIIVVIGYFLGIDVSPIIGNVEIETGSGEPITQADEQAAEFTARVLGVTEDIWAEVYPEQTGQPYDPPVLVLYKGATRSSCGGASAATGPFYCPGDQKIYLDTDFFTVLDRRLGAGGDFAAAYVIAHEVAHSVQDQLGILRQANQVRAQVSERESNEISVRLELQADCYSGIWARYVDQELGLTERGDIREAVHAAAQIGDDTLQRNAGQIVMPHTFTHGSSAQRQRWFAQGFETGDMRSCDTFSASRL